MTIARWSAGVLLVLLTGSGCVSRTAGSASDGPAPPSEAPPTAADGSDVTACADGNCAVWLEDAMEIPVPGGALSITVVDGDKIEYEVTINGSTGSGSTEGNCVSTFTLDGTGSGSICYASDYAPDPDPAPGEMAMLVDGQGTDAPVLRLATG